jgi:hypothetical protein
METVMYVFKIIHRILNRMLPSPMLKTTNLSLLEEAEILMKEIKQATTLAELLRVKAVLQKFRGAVELAGSPHAVKNKLMFLEAQWNKRFRIWKTKE